MLWTIALSLPKAAVAALMLWAGLRLHAKLAGIALDAEVRERANPAAAAWLAGQCIGLALALRGALQGGGDVVDTMIGLVVGGSFALVALPFGSWLVDGLVLHKFQVREEVKRDQNLGTGLVLGGGAVATGLTLQAALLGHSSSIGAALLDMAAYFILGQALLILGAWAWTRVAPYDVHDALEHHDSVAVGASMAGFLIAIGVVMHHVVAGGSSDWGHLLLLIVLDGAVGVLVQLAVTVPLTHLLIRAAPGRLIGQEHNAAAGVIAGAAAVAVALLFAGALPTW